MNPPSALYGAMNKERKPFTYTPGGLDLSEIKSERMAQRLIRNAMSEGVPESQVQTIHSYPAQLNSSAIPNFNCLPVQVFPTFPLPANPKSLLRTRSNPDPPKELLTNTESKPSLFLSDDKPSTHSWKNINTLPSLISNNNNNCHQTLPINNKTLPINSNLSQFTNYGSNGNTEVLLPEKSYDAEYFVMEPQGNDKLFENKTVDVKDNTSLSTKPDLSTYISVNTATDFEKNPLVLLSTSSQDRTTNDLQQKEVTILKKKSKTENEADHNGDTEAAVVVKLPSKKSSAKTETKVEVLKKTLPDGSIEEVKTTITKTTIDGKTEIKTETETTILPKEFEEVVEIEEEEEESENVVIEENESEQKEDVLINESSKDIPIGSEDENEEELKKAEKKENGHIVNGEEKVEVRTTKNVIVSQSTEQESEEEEEEEIEEQEEEVEETEDGDVEVEQVIVLKKQINKENDESVDADNNETEKTDEVKEEENEDVEEEEVVEEENGEEDENPRDELKRDIEEAEEEEVDHEEDKQNQEVDEAEEQDEHKIEPQEKETEKNLAEDDKKQEDKVEEKYEEAEDVQPKPELSDDKIIDESTDKTVELIKEDTEKSEQVTNENSSAEPSVLKEDINKQQLKDEPEGVQKITVQTEPKVSFREPSIPFEKVEDIDIKPIGPAQEIIKKCHTEIITTTKDEPTGALSTQTEYNRVENIVTVNRTTKTLDHAYEQSEPTIPTLKTYFLPHNDRILSTPQPISRPYQPVYTPEPQAERRHSLLLDRLSIERQIPVQNPDIYQNNYQYSNQSYEQNQWLQEPQSEVLTVSNVKPSTITKNQQWYQQNRREENVTSNIVTPTPIMPSQQLSQSQPPSQTKPQYQSYVQPQYTPKPEFQPTYKDNINQNSFKSDTTNFQQNIYPSYTPKPTWVSSTFETKPAPTAQIHQYSTLKSESNENYQKTPQQYSSSYVPPPWEQDSSYIVENQNFYQPPPPSTEYTPNINQTWKPKQPPSKFSKPTPTSYIPPAPNQSFVKPVTNTESLPGRKTYYSEYERRYISVPESTYIPSETKFQAQPDPSPQYYFDNNEPSETVEPQWRKELREFTEKTSQSTISQTEKQSVRPPWEDDPKYTAPPAVTPTWTQTLRPRSWRERSYEPEYIGSNEWPKTNTLGRGRPQNSYLKSNVNTIQERSRGVSVDRYNPNSYQSPLSSEQPPVQSQTLTPNIHPKAYHNPNVPAYHARASAEPREQSVPYIQRTWGESRAPPIQSRSFKYLQWITGTED